MIQQKERLTRLQNVLKAQVQIVGSDLDLGLYRARNMRDSVFQLRDCLAKKSWKSL